MTKRFLKETINALLVAVFVLVMAYIFLGYAKYGLSSPYSYSGGDDFSMYVTAKNINETGWFWDNTRIGAPFGSNSFDFSANMLMNFDFLVTRLISIFSDNPITIINVQFLLIFPMCAVTAFLVLKLLKLEALTATFGSIVFALSPYVFYRNIPHLSLAACYFIPFSVLLCIWCASDRTLLVFEKSFFKKPRNVAVIIMCLLIANNGIGYYAFFTCFFLCVIALCTAISEKSIRRVAAPLKTIGLIVFFMAIAFIPSIVYEIAEGSNPDAIVRSVADGELYSLKLSQFFIPLSGHGLDVINKIISKYNTNMPLVNENIGSYLGIAGIVGLIMSLLCIANYRKENSLNDNKSLLSRMNIFGILFAGVGGFCSLFCLVITNALRGFNRISIFILFTSICVLCYNINNWVVIISLKQKSKKVFFTICLTLFTALCVWDLLPDYGSHDQAFENNNLLYNSDCLFVEQIEDTLGENAMVFQLPYHKTPEGGSVNSMADYQLYTGYIHSNTIKWSYGGTKGRNADIWNKNVSSLPIPDMLNEIVRSGFSGLYIDVRAYDSISMELLTSDISKLLGSDGIYSENGNLLFYDLRQYAEKKELDINSGLSDVQIDENARFFLVSDLSYLGETVKTLNSVTLKPGTIQYGPYCNVKKGNYIVTFTGSGLEEAEFDVTFDSGTEFFSINEKERSNTAVSYSLAVTEDIEGVEFRTINSTKNDIVLSRIALMLNN